MIFNLLARIPNVALLVQPMVHLRTVQHFLNNRIILLAFLMIFERMLWITCKISMNVNLYLPAFGTEVVIF